VTVDTSRLDRATARYEAAFQAIACRPVYDASNHGEVFAAQSAAEGGS
jgi:hypothetical protein